MIISLQDITKDNLDAVCDLSVTEAQEEYVAINAYSIAESAYNDGYTVKAIYQDETAVGFLMWVQANDHKVDIWRFMVDKKYQNHGIGRQGLALAIEAISLDQNVRSIGICYSPENHTVRNFYLSFGFVETGLDAEQIEMWAEIVVNTHSVH